jgi:hypothetical protein
MREKAQHLLMHSSDAALTTSDLRRKYEEAPSSPRRTSGLGSALLRDRQSSTGFAKPAASFRCWACSTTLRDPGATFFSCGACGALNGNVPKRASPGTCGGSLFAQHGRIALAACGLVLVWGITKSISLLLLPYHSEDGVAFKNPHAALAAFLSVGVVFNFLATVLAGPGFVTEEVCPLKRAADPRFVEAGLVSDLARLRASAGELPLRGWRRCEVTGVSMPPRSEYCAHCKRVVLRNEMHCILLNACIGHRNHHYFLRLLSFLVAASAYVAVAVAFALSAAAATRSSSSRDPVPQNLIALLSLWVQTGDGAATLLLLGAVSLTAFGLALYTLATQLWLVRHGLTRVESKLVPSPTDFDLGASSNCREVFGRNTLAMLTQLLPLPRSPVGDGIVFATGRRAAGVTRDV